MKLSQVGLVALTVVALSSCGKKEPVKVKPVEPPQATQTSAASTSNSAPNGVTTPPLLDVGKFDAVPAQATGYGTTVAGATTEAMKNAILQINGATINTGSVQVQFGLDVTSGKNAMELRASEFAELVAQKSGGAITNFKIVDVVEPGTGKNGQVGPNGLYKVSIQANIAHFSAPVDTKKVKVVVGPIQFDVASFNVGGESISAQKIADDINQQVETALTNTGRFIVLDRASGDAIQNELDMIKSGQAPRTENGKLGQANSADVIWTGHIDALAYNRYARQLMITDSPLVSYSGNWGISEKLINVATRQILSSDTLKGSPPGVGGTTMGSGVNSGKILQGIEADMATEIIASILTRTFPITVVSQDGNNVVLSQGGQAVQQGTRYAMVVMGKEIKDPQTGESLGKLESPCCEVVIDKITPKLSYGHLENISIPLDNIPEGGLQLREKLKVSGQKTAAQDAQTPASASTTKHVVAHHAAKPADEPSIQKTKEDGKW